MTIGKFCSVLILGILTSFFIFPVGFVGLPESLNTKQIMAVIGVLLFVVNSIKDRFFGFNRTIFISSLLALVFSLWCFFCVTVNNTDDFSYATYIRSYVIWLSAAYCLVYFMRFEHGTVSIGLLIKYLLLISVFQCLVAVLIDNAPALRSLVNSIFIQDLRAVDGDRLYGIGASLDSGGIRFATSLILTSYLIVNDTQVSSSRVRLSFYLFCFSFVTILGSTIARTTLIGAALGLLYMFGAYSYTRYLSLTRKQVRFWIVLLLGISFIAFLSISLYRSIPVFKDYVRFAFESFFNYFERGTFSSRSTDILMNMWIWPTNTDGWIFGYGNFDNWYYHTDIGYCRFVLYCGIVGVVLFSIFFLYNAYSIKDKFVKGPLLSLFLLVMVFVIWVKVSTDIFQFFALLLLINGDFEQEEEIEDCVKDEIVDLE